jgi:hypothetical protein
VSLQGSLAERLDIARREALRHRSTPREVKGRTIAEKPFTEDSAEYVSPRGSVRKRKQEGPLEASLDGGIQVLRTIRGAEHCNGTARAQEVVPQLHD